jgi:hypothetical protein
MAEMKLDEMLGVIRDEAHYRNDTYKRVNGSMTDGKSWYTNDTAGNARFLEDLKKSPAAPAAAVGGVVPGYSDAAYAALPAAQRHMMLADLEMPHYNNKQSSKSWRTVAIATVAAGALALFGQSKIPSVSIDESVAQYEIQRQEVDVQDYMRTHEGRSPPWQKSPETIRMDNTTNYTPIKSFLLWGGILSLIGSAVSGAYSFFKRK